MTDIKRQMSIEQRQYINKQIKEINHYLVAVRQYRQRKRPIPGFIREILEGYGLVEFEGRFHWKTEVETKGQNSKPVER